MKIFNPQISSPSVLLFLFLSYLHFQTTLAFPPYLFFGAVAERTSMLRRTNNQEFARDASKPALPISLMDARPQIHDEFENDDQTSEAGDHLFHKAAGSSEKFHSRSIRSPRFDRTIESGVREILAEQSGVPIPELGLNSRLVQDLGVDSIGLVEMVLAAETRFGNSISI